MKQGYFTCPATLIGGFKHNWHVVEAAVFHETLEKVYAKQANADIVVPVNTRSKRFLGIVQVYRFQIFKPYHAFQFTKSTIIVSYNVITCRIKVTGINADTHTVLVLNAVNYISDFLQFITHIATLPCGILNYSCHAIGL